VRGGQGSRAIVATACVVVAAAGLALGGAAAAATPVYSVPFDDPVAAAAAFGLADGLTQRELGDGTATFTPGALTIDLDGNEQVFLEPDWGDGGIPTVPKDVAVEATIASNRGGRTRQFGVACRAERGRGMYAFVVGVDGRYEIRRYDGVKSYGTNMVNPAKAKPTKAVDASGQNVVRAECTGSKKAKLTLFVNGKRVVTVTDPKPPTGKRAGDDAFVITEVSPSEPATVVFSSFSVSEL
jgi:hypothetical protein